MAQIIDAIETSSSSESPSSNDAYLFPTSFAQQRLWFLDQFEPGSPFYNIPLAVRLQGRLDIDVLRRVLVEIVRRHEILRTTFIALDGQPMQLVTPFEASGADPLPLPVTDLSHLPDDQREAEMYRLATWEAQRPFDLRAGPLVRAALLRLTDDDHLALLTLHHIIADGWSMGVLLHELATLYAAFVAGRPAPLPDLPIQYADYAVWQRETLARSAGDGVSPLDRQLAYWRERLADAPAALDLPTDRPRPPVQSSRGASCSARLPQALAERLRALGRQAGATLFMTLEAAFAVLLRRYSGQEEVCIGTPVAGRSRPELEGLIGCFINTLVLRHDLRGSPTFREVLERTRATALEAFAHQEAPFELVVEAVQAARDISRTPLFQVMFILQNAPASVHQLPGLTLTQIDVETGTSTFDLTLSATEDVEGVALAVEYCTDLFTEGTIHRLLTHYRVLLEGIVADPACPIDRLPLLSAEERSTLLNWGGVVRPSVAPTSTIVERFEAEADRAPDAEAVVWGDTRLNYADLDRRANQLAHYLRRLGVRPGVLVGIALERSADLVVAVLGVLKAGGAYVPLDPAYPSERLAGMLADARPAVVLTGAATEAWLAAGDGQVVDLAAATAAIAACPAQRLDNGATPDDLAYVIYTSGSTGPAKGVMVTHAALSNACDAWERAYDLRRAARRHLQMASFSFDVFVGDLVRALCCGGALVLCPRETLLEPARLYDLLYRERIDCAEFVPGVLRLLIDYLNDSGQRLDWMRLVICGSDTWFVGEYRRVMRLCSPDTRIINSFGLTETTIDSTYFDGGVHALLDEQSVPIGRPFDGVRLFILDQHRQPTPIGVPGELYIGGVGVARGYLNRPDLTAERFVLLEGFGNDGNGAQVQRVYRTGDRARWLPDGNIEFLGRLDHQIKIRGYRVEPGEIEAVLVRHPAVRAAAVTLHHNAPGGPRLAAYLEPVASDAADERNALVASVRRWLEERLPEYMIPSAFVTLDALPLTPNGKIDRRALPAPDWSARAAEAAFVAPRTPIEELLAGVWSDLLGVARISAQDDFFALGGHSLLATQLVARIRATLGVELPVRAVFEAPRLADLAQRVADVRRHDGHPPAPPIRPQPRDGRRFPLSFAQQRLWFLDQLEPGSAFYNIPEVVRLRGRLDVAALERALNLVARRQEALRMRIVTGDGQPALVIEPPGALEAHPLRIPVRDLRALPVNEREPAALRIAEADVRQPFRLDQAPLMRALALRLADDDHLIVLTIHHIIGDAWSTNILVQELTACYEALIGGRSLVLPDLPVQYADYAVWQREWLQGETLAQRLSFWREHLSGLPPLLNLPTDRPRPAVQTYNGAYTTFRLPVRLSAALRTLAQHESATLFMTLLTAFAALLQRYSGQEEFAIGVPVAGRSHAELEGVIGFFVNTLALRMNLTGHPSFHEAVQRVRATALDASAHQDVPFDMVVDALHPARTLSHSPIFQVMMVMQNDVAIGSVGRGGAGMQAESVTLHSGAAKFDLTLFVIDDGAVIEGAFEYNTDLFDGDRITRMIGHLETLLEEIVANPDQPLDRLPILTPAERQQLLVEWNRTATPFPADRCVHDLVLDQAARTPDAIAVEGAAERLTYADLMARATALAHQLRAAGVGPDTLVAVAIPRSPDLLAALLGVWLAGGAYVPLDLRHPPARQQALLADARPVALLTATTSGDHLAGPWRVIDVTAIPGAAAPPPTSAVTPDHLAYVLYTSGSTGAPKGVMVTHRGLVNYLTWCVEAYAVAAGRGALVHTPVTFDLTVTGLFAPLLVGRTVYLLPDDADLEDLAAALLAHDDLSLVKITPAHLDALQMLIPPERAAGRTRAFIIGGENLRGETLRFWQTCAPQTRLVNEYGPTETVVGCCVYTALPGEMWRIVPIGRPIANTQLYVLDANRQPVPVGVVGELYIGGAGVARGYLNRPDLTAERFVQAPEHPEIAGVVYRSGDLVRYRGDGVLECLGRTDHQVKIRGFRIELEEIEAQLAAHPAVAAAAVTVHADGTGGKRLVAYVTPANAAVPSAAELQAFLAQRLPEYMVPAIYLPLATLPLTPNGKVDRAALPPPPVTDQTLRDAAPPETPVEQTLAGIWAAVLGVAQVGREDNFFALGGDSILSIQVVARARQAGIQVKARDLFQTRTLAELAQAAAAATGGALAEQGMVQGDVPLTPIQRWFFAQAVPHPHHWNQAVLLALPEALDPSALTAAVQAILVQHDMLRARFIRSDAGWRQTIMPPDGDPPVAQRDLTLVDDADLTATITAECRAAQASLHLERGPLVRAVQFDLGAGRGARLLLAVHHLVIDAVSWGVVLADLHTAYAQARAAQPIRLPPKTTSFKVWAERLVAGESAEMTHSEADYWNSVIRLPIARLPTDRTGSNVEADAQRISVALDEEETGQLLEGAAHARTSVIELLLAALARALGGWAGGPAILIDVERHGREDLFEDIDVSRTVGWFTTIYPVRIDYEPGEAPIDTIRCVHRQMRDLPRHGIGYGLLRDQQAISGASAEISFNYYGRLDRGVSNALLSVIATDERGPDRDPTASRPYLIEIDGGIVAERLHLEWTYSRSLHNDTTIAQVARTFLAELRAMMHTCRHDSVGSIEAADVAEFGWNDEDLSAIMAELDRHHRSS
jgi:amino acid adenylation domain-containing protein/non-ribosomal peptide synthase protein (TIGR01720 family)